MDCWKFPCYECARPDAGSVIADADKHPCASENAFRLYYNWSGQFESEIRAKKRAPDCRPDCHRDHLHPALSDLPLLLEAAHVLLAVPFALTGGSICSAASL